MEQKRKCCCRSKSAKKADVRHPDFYAGTAVNKADDETVNPEHVKERTAALNNNPRNDEQ